MPDHIHISLCADNSIDLAGFIQHYASTFARESNLVCRRCGPLFNTPFGSSVKKGDKRIRTNLIYLDNNPVERHLCTKAEDYRWNFVAYGKSPNPFSDKIVLSRASKALRSALKVIDSLHQNGQILRYQLLQRLFGSLESKAEKQQLVDYIITKYSVIDHDAAIDYFGSYDTMLEADHASSGSEFDIKEMFVGRTDAVYGVMSSLLLATGRFEDIHEVLTLPADEKLELYRLLCKKTPATAEQVAKFLRIGRGGEVAE